MDPSWWALCFNRPQSRNCCFDQNHENSHGLKSHLLHGRNNTTRKRGGNLSARVRRATVFFHGRFSCKHTRLPTPWLARTIWGREKLDAKKERTERTKFFEFMADRTGPSFLPTFRRSHVMRAIWSVRPKCSHRCVSLTETSLKPVQTLKHTTKNSAEQTAMRTKWFKHIAI